MILKIGSKVNNIYFRIVQASQVKRGFCLAYTFNCEKDDQLLTKNRWLTYHIVYFNNEKLAFS